MNKKDTKKVVKEAYSTLAREQKKKERKSCCSNSCASNISRAIGYKESELGVAPDADMGLGCGNPTAIGEINSGDVVLDLGAGAGLDCFLAAEKVGEEGRVIGVDITDAMTKSAEENARKYGYKNVEFRLGDIENLPIDDCSIDVIISNCVLNLAPNKEQVFSEAYRVLKDNGKMIVSDIVLLEELSKEQRNDSKLIAGCVGGALLKEDYISKAKRAGLSVKVLSENKEISKQQYNGIPLESITIKATKVV